MKIVHLVTFNNGGAYRAAKRISDSLNKCSGNIESCVITSSDIKMSLSKKVLQRLKHKFFTYIPFSRRNSSYYFNNDLETMPVLNMRQIKEADIIHLHWIADGLLSTNKLHKLLKYNKPIVWTLHDMHPFTGGCHYNDGCEQYMKNCGMCKQINSNRKKDFSTRNQKKKREALSDANMAVVGCSKWITNCALESSVMKNHYCVSIPNCIETEIYKPIIREYAREILNINVGDKKVIAFGAMNSLSDKRKGFEYLKQAMSQLDPDKYALLVLGSMSESCNDIQMNKIEFLHDDYSLALFYAAADVFVAPSIQENLANTVMESLSCGTPVVAFKIGGMTDMVIHKHNGYLATPFNVDDLSEGIQYCCENSELGSNARQFVINHFTEDIISREYTNLYEKLLQQKG